MYAGKEEPEMTEKKRNLWQIAGRLAMSLLIIACVVLVTWLICRRLGWDKLTREQLQDKIESFGAWAPFIFIGLSFLQVTFIPIPSTMTILAGNYVFGTWLSYLYSWIGIMGGSLFAFFLGKTLGRPFVNWVLGGKEKTEQYLTKLRGKEVVLLFFMFVLPMFPDDALCAVAGMLRIRFMTFLGMQLISRTLAIGGTLFFMSGEIIPLHGWGLWVIGAVAVLSLVAFVLAYRRADAINTALNRIADNLTRRFKRHIPHKAGNTPSHHHSEIRPGGFVGKKHPGDS